MERKKKYVIHLLANNLYYGRSRNTKKVHTATRFDSEKEAIEEANNELEKGIVYNIIPI